MKTNTKHTLKLTTLAKTLIVAGVIGVVSAPAAATKYNNYRNFNNSTYDHARVVDVVPVTERIEVNNPIEQCWDERVRVESRYSNQRYDQGTKHYTRTPEILGGIIGGLLGNRIGHGDGRKIATVAGAVLGASVGRDVKHKNSRQHQSYSNRDYDRYETVRRCEMRDSYTTEEHVIGYDVAYKYQGNVFHTQMDQHPGDKIKVKVTVNPV